MSLREKFVGLLADAMKQAAAEDDTEEEQPIVDECPAGGEHDVVEIRPATSREAVFRYCKRCRADLTGK